MKRIDENGNEKVRKIEKIIGNGLERRFIFVDENENELGNETRNEPENEQSIWKKIKNIL